MNGPDREETVFASALTLPAEQRLVYLDEACAGDADLRRRVVELLEAHEGRGRFMEAPAAPIHAKPAAIPLLEKPGDRVGRYKLMEQIGEGGCGVVYVAEQEEPVRRRVALKVLKLGMDTREVMARFEAERQALALMDHPGIAKFFDAGVTCAGRPFFVMELVRGTPITDFCEEHRLSARDRLQLFIQACRAVQHAHQKGVIHRDLKPSNILVASHDGVPVPKVIDFGIAKATQGRLTDHTVYTAFAQFMGTPAYMSPEQAGLSSLDIDTRSDIYSLGVLLYELLAGRPPFENKELLAVGLDEMRRTIREIDPPRPSTRLKRARPFPGRASLQCRIPNAESEIDPDLDWIVMKALDKDRTRRYETANGLASDVERHLRHEPVVARPPTGWYRLQKTMRRHRAAFAAAAAIALVTIAGVVASAWQAIRATHAEREQARLRRKAEQSESNENRLRQKAESEAARSQQVARFLEDMLKGVGPSVALGRDTKLLREIVDRTATRITQDLRDQPAVEAVLRNTLGELYLDLGEYRKAETMFRDELELLRKRLGNEDPGLATPLGNLANVLSHRGQYAQAEPLFLQALELKKKLRGQEHPDVASLLNGLAVLNSSQGKMTNAEALFRQSLQMRTKLLGDEHPQTIESLNNLAGMLMKQDKLNESESLNRQVLEMRTKRLGPEHPDIAQSLNNLGTVLWKAEKLGEAEDLFRQAIQMRRRLLGNQHPNVADSVNNLAVVLMNQNKLAEAETLFGEALELRKRIYGDAHHHVANTLNNLAIVFQKQGKLDEAETMYRRALEMTRKLLGDEHPEVASFLNNLAQLATRQNKLAEAESLNLQALALRRKLYGNEHAEIAMSLYNLGTLFERQGKLAEAESRHREALEMRRKTLGNNHPYVTESLQSLARVLKRENRVTESEAADREALAVRGKPSGNSNEEPQ